MSPLSRIRSIAATALVLALVGGAALGSPALAEPAAPAIAAKPTIVLVHGAWADSSSWGAVTATLQVAGYVVLVAPNGLRSLSGDAAALSAFVTQRTAGPVVLVGHSYGGAVITNAATTLPSVKALVFIDAFIPDQGESLGSIVAGSTSALNVPDPTSVFDVIGYPNAPAGDAEVYLKASTFSQSFAQDAPALVRNSLAAGQLPITLAALSEPSGAPAWKNIPSWAFVGTQDRVLPAATQLSEARRAGSTITQASASHLSMISKPVQVAAVIIQAAKSVR
ncbi:alpha/beta hydrolase [soil metagenome]